MAKYDQPAPWLEAVLFDMDGVVTDTAQAHAAAWKRLFDDYLQQRARRSGEPFQPFDADRDYRQTVDGKPRVDGVRCFLESRAITLPYGAADDPPDAETLCGLGKRKNQYFQAWLEQHQVRAYPGTLQLLAQLRERGIRTAVFSASQNAEQVLSNAGVLALFDTKVDGRDLAVLGLPGKPDAAMLLVAAARLGVVPARCAVLEDALAGVEAGARGGFGRVIGIDRGDYARDLLAAGAQMVVQDVSELTLDHAGSLVIKTLTKLPSVWQAEVQLRSRLSTQRPVVFLDYDGTLTPIVADPAEALLSQPMRAAVAQLARHCPVAIISGRDLPVVRALVGLDEVFYAGSHGFEIAGPQDIHVSLEKGVEFLPSLDRLEQALRDGLQGIKGHLVERKRFSIAVHYRQVADREVAQVETLLDQLLSTAPDMRKGHGKKVFEVQPNLDWNKGRAVLWLLQQLKLDGPDVVPIYVGDDLTDEHAFRVLAGRGLSIVVRDYENRPTAADFTLTGTAEVRRFLVLLSELASQPDAPGVERGG